jgi:hypothetical protein
MTTELVLDGANKPEVKDIPVERVAQNDAAHQAQLLKRPKEEAQAVLEQYDARGFTRAWESAMAPIEAEDDVGEYDANVLAAKRAARAVVVG